MDQEIIKKIIAKGEGVSIEFKEAVNDVPSNMYETVCAFLNRNGGIIILGVNKKGKVVGVNEFNTDSIINSIVTTSNNKNKLNPPFILFPNKITLKEGLVIYIQVPESSQVHKCDDIIYDRSDDGDFKVTDQHLVTSIYNRKSTHYTEGHIYPEVKLSDLNINLFPKIKELIGNRSPAHPWLSLSKEELLSISGLKRHDFLSGQEGFTLASIMLLGKDYLIQSILPHYKIEALVRIENVDRYDDRLQVTTNLIDAYDLLMEFIAKHLPDKFFMEGDQRVNLREKIFREVIANMIIHREYTNAHPASLTIYRDRVELLNANKPHHYGKINPINFSPYPKNPLISKFFLQLGRAEEIGSGILNVNKYLLSYSPNKVAEFIDDDIFKTIIPVVVKEKVEVFIEQFKTIADVVAITGINGSLSDVVNDAVRTIVTDAVSETVSSAVSGRVSGRVSGGVSGRVSGGVSDAVSDAISDAVKERIKDELIAIILENGLTISKIKSSFQIERATAQRDMKILRDFGFVKFEGAPKSGRYVATEKTKNIKIKKGLI